MSKLLKLQLKLRRLMFRTCSQSRLSHEQKNNANATITSANDLQSRVPGQIKRPAMTDSCGDLRPPRQLHHSTSSDSDYPWCCPPVVSLYCGPLAHIVFATQEWFIQWHSGSHWMQCNLGRTPCMHSLGLQHEHVTHRLHQQPCSMTASTRPALMAVLLEL